MKSHISNKIASLIKKNGYPLGKEIKKQIELLSQMIEAQEFSSVGSVLKWLEEKRKSPPINIKEMKIKDLQGWSVDHKTGNISHQSDKFFQIIGVKVSQARGREVTGWTQPMIKQDECGILGILCQRKDGIMRYLMYAKCEPGSVVNPQLSPTLQATFSNLERYHGGKKPLFSEYFENPKKGKIVVSVEQIEDPSRFYLKTNRCIIVEIPQKEKIKVTDDFVWLTLLQIKKILKIDRAVNALARAVFGSL